MEVKTNEKQLNARILKIFAILIFFSFETTDELEPIYSGIGQDRGIKALEFGLNVDVRGNNLY